MKVWEAPRSIFGKVIQGMQDAKVLLMALLATFSLHAEAATFAFSESSDIAVTLRVDGEIRKGDYLKMLDTIVSNPLLFMKSNFVVLDSPGGDVHETEKIASVIEKVGYATRVDRGDSCASACFMLYVAGAIRSPAGSILIHRPYFEKPANDLVSQRERQSLASKRMRLWLEDRNVPRSIIDAMMQRASNDVYELTPQDITEIGLMAPWFEELVIKECDVSARNFTSDFRDHRKIACMQLFSGGSRARFLDWLIGEEKAAPVIEEYLKVVGLKAK